MSIPYEFRTVGQFLQSAMSLLEECHGTIISQVKQRVTAIEDLDVSNAWLQRNAETYPKVSSIHRTVYRVVVSANWLCEVRVTGVQSAGLSAVTIKHLN